MRAGGLLLLFSETKELSAHVRCGHTYIPHRATIIHTFRGQDHTHISLHVAPAFILLKPRTRVVEHVVGCRHPRLLPMTVCSRSIGVGGRLEYEVCFFPCSVWPYIHPAPGYDHTYIYNENVTSLLGFFFTQVNVHKKEDFFFYQRTSMILYRQM